MASYNKCVILGNLCRDPELRSSPSGVSICSITLAVTRKWKDQSGEGKEETSFVDCTAFSKTADVIAKYAKKGDPLLVDGRLRTESWTDKQTNQKRSKLVVIVETVQLLRGRSDAKPAAPAEPAPASAPPTEAPPTSDDQVPF